MNLDQVSGAAGERESRARVLSALGDPLRLGVVDLLQGQDVSPDALASALEVPGNLLAHHLKVLEAAGVVTRSHSQNDRRRTYVHLVAASLEGLLHPSPSIEASRVVFVCTHNSARSVLAEALWRSMSDVPSASAGTQPADRINPRARTAARRAGLTVQDAAPRAIDDVVLPDDVVVSVCDAVNEELGALPNPRIHWSVPDPSRLDTDAAFATAVADLGDRVSHLAPRVRYRRHTPTRKASR